MYVLSILGTTKNTHFLEQVSRIFGKDDEILVVRLLDTSWVQNRCCSCRSYFRFLIEKNTLVIYFQGCQSGRRSLMAATELHSAVSMIIPCILYHVANRFLASYIWFMVIKLNSMQLFSGFHWCNRYHRWILFMERERTAYQPVMLARKHCLGSVKAALLEDCSAVFSSFWINSAE